MPSFLDTELHRPSCTAADQKLNHPLSLFDQCFSLEENSLDFAKSDQPIDFEELVHWESRAIQLALVTENT